MKLDNSQITKQIAPILSFVKRFRFLLAFIAFSVMYGYVIMQVNAINEQTPSEKLISDKITKSPRPKVEKELVNTITNLEDQNVQIRTIFNEARKNPFDE